MRGIDLSGSESTGPALLPARPVLCIAMDLTMSVDVIASDPRVTVRNHVALEGDARCVLYWMERARRAHDNPALNTAIQIGNLLEKPVVVLCSLALSPPANLRHYTFVAEGLAELEEELAARGVGFLLCNSAGPAFVAEMAPGLVISDENPLREAEAWRTRAAGELRVPFWTVDADVVVPSRLLGREHWAARTIRPRIREQIGRFLVKESAPRARVPWPASAARKIRTLDPRTLRLDRMGIERSISPVSGFRGGPRRARAQLRRFLRERLVGYAGRRNRPEIDGTSQLSPYLHFGHIGPRQVALAVREADAPEQDREAFLEELIVRRELAVNFVRYNPRYDRLEGCERWARETLRRHAHDRRDRVPVSRLVAAESPDPLWNAAQRQMLETGWMHGYMRMYWAKRLLEWTASPEEAYSLAVVLNDTYELDGSDPNGYAGIAWAIGGKHDRAWPERPVFGKVRFMSSAGAARKFDVRAYVERFQPMTPDRA